MLYDPAAEVAALPADFSAKVTAACWEKNMEAVADRLEWGANPNDRDPDSGLTLIMIAAGTGNLELVSLLLGKGADPFVVDSGAGGSLLGKACQGKNVEVVKLLLDRGVLVDTISTTTGHTPLMDAIWFKSPEIAQVLLEHGASLNLSMQYGFGLLDHLQFELNVNSSDRKPFERIDAMIRARQESDAAAKASQMVMAATIQCDAEMVEALLAAGHHFDEVSPALNSFNDSQTPLHIACRDGHTDVVRVLLQHGADPNTLEPTLMAVPLHKAVYNGHAEITAMFVQAAGIDLDRQGLTNGDTPLHDALWHGYADCAQILVEAGAWLDLRGHDGTRPVDLARMFPGNEHAVTRMIEQRQ